MRACGDFCPICWLDEHLTVLLFMPAVILVVVMLVSSPARDSYTVKHSKILNSDVIRLTRGNSTYYSPVNTESWEWYDEDGEPVEYARLGTSGSDLTERYLKLKSTEWIREVSDE